MGIRVRNQDVGIRFSNFKQLKSLDTGNAKFLGRRGPRFKKIASLEKIETVSATDKVIIKCNPKILRQISTVSIKMPETLAALAHFEKLEHVHVSLNPASELTSCSLGNHYCKFGSRISRPRNISFRWISSRLEYHV